MKTERFNSKVALDNLNLKAKKYHIWMIIAILVFILANIILLSLNVKTPLHRNFMALFKILELHGSLIILIAFFLATKTKLGKYLYFKEMILLKRLKPGDYTISHFIKVSSRAFASFLIFFVIAFMPLISMVFTGQFDHEAYAKYSGAFFVLVILVFFVCYGVILLPEIIQNKTNKTEYKYIYWFYFIKGRMTSSGFTLFLGIPFVLMTSVIIILSTLTFEEKPEIGNQINIENYLISESNAETVKRDSIFVNNINNKQLYDGAEKIYLKADNILDVSRFGLYITCFGVWLSIITLLVSDLLKFYSRIYSVYEDYTTYILRERMINKNTITHILIGYGRLNKRSLVQLIKNQIKQKNEVEKNLMNEFELIIDRQFELRFISRKTVVIDINSGVFEEIRKDTNSGIEYGFVNSGELAISEEHPQFKIQQMGTFGIIGDGSELAIQKLAGIDNADLIIHASSQENIGFKLKILLEEQISRNKPVLITTVRDSASYAYLETKNNLAIFPVNPTMTEGLAIGSRLFMILYKLHKINSLKENNKLFDGKVLPFIVFLGRGKAVYYAIKQFFVNALANDFGSVEDFIHENFMVVSDDPQLKSQSKSDENNNHYWKCELGHKKRIAPVLFPIAPDTYDNIKFVMDDLQQKSALKEDNNSGKTNESKEQNIKPFNSVFYTPGIIFVVIPFEPHEGLRITYNVKQAISDYGNIKTTVLASVESQYLQGHKASVASLLPNFKLLLGDTGFPYKAIDLIIRKDVVSGSQITSLMECLQKEKADDTVISNNKCTVEKIPVKTGVIAICADNYPGVLAETICLISGISGLKPTVNSKYIPSFYYSYSYRVTDNDQKWDDTFIFRGDCMLTEGSITVGLSRLNDISMNGTKDFLEKYTDYYKSKVSYHRNAIECGFHPSCPVSSNSTVTMQNGDKEKASNESCEKSLSKNTVNPEKISDILANVKIWAEKDSIPGSLAVALSDFLMLGADLQLDAEINRTPILNIVYEASNLCTMPNMLTMRFFTKEADIEREEILYERKKLMDRSNIIGIKIKLSNKADDYWKEHFKQLKDYTNNFCDTQYDSFEMKDEFHLFRKQIRDVEGARAFFDTL